MVSEIRLYVEGGGDRRSNALFREGFNAFLREVQAQSRGRCRWSVIPCGGRDHAFDDFRDALATHRDAFNLLLIDSDEPVDDAFWQWLRGRRPPGARDDQCHLMAQAMEAWLIADPEALARFYRQGFNPNAFPRARDVETIARADLEPALKRDTRSTQRGEYRKVPDGPELLKRVDPARVRARAAHCRRLFDSLQAVIAER